jgi:acetyl/propionyl-CoA carboxylase alpha subunit
MIAKLITHGKNRDEAIQRMVRAIGDYKITGCQTTLPFCSWAIQHEAFVSGNFDTHFVKKYFSPEVLLREDEDEMTIAGMAAVLAFLKKNVSSGGIKNEPLSVSKWKANRSAV